MQIDYKFSDEAIRASIQRLQELGTDMTPITRGIAAVLASEADDAFQKEADPATGKKWQQLTQNYAAQLATRGLTGKMLNRSMGGLAMSLTTDFDAVSAAIGSNKVYAAIHQLGGTPGMPNAPAAIPARPYMGLSQNGISDIIDIINITLSNAINDRP
ncbi:phage virion morphogenesis protein [Gilliamella sp. W8126]|uniref:phage virion morphogenesis protein n=1 Tax=Gilliamella sp. W8126 TaxID=2750946 RepID=UPI0018DD9669|nr:phage virion morphogenesis protein [Gilliamella sp. W8126]MBI0004942.1 phage virion morphogenesis protein [Gilliamella sp. W8126]